MTGFALTVRRLLVAAVLGCCLPALGQPSPEILITGVDGPLRDNVRAHLAIAGETCTATERRLRLMLRHSDEEIDVGLQALGYYGAHWQKTLTMTEKCWRLAVAITPGEPVRFERVSVSLDTDSEGEGLFRPLLADLPVKKGDILNHQKYEKIKSSLRDQAQQFGYLDAGFDRSKLEVNRETRQAFVDIVFRTGGRYFFGDLSFLQDTYDPDFLQRYVSFKPGDPYDVDVLVAFHQDLNNSRYFQTVDLKVDTDNSQDRRVPLRVTTTPVAKYGYSFGAGFATDTGPRGSFTFDNRRVNSTGHRYALQTGISGINKEVTFNYQMPGDNPMHERINIEAGWNQEHTDTADSTSIRLGVNKTDLAFTDWVRVNGIEYLNEEYELADDINTSELIILSSNWTKTRSNTTIYPTRGWRLSGTLRGADENLGSDVSLLQVLAKAKLIRPLGRGRILTRLDLGASMVSDFSRVPASLRFFAGGDNSVRGYDYESLGPEDENGEVIGGKHLATASIEYDRLVWKNFGFAFFYDAGNAFDTSQFDVKSGAGVGLRWQSPIGMIRVDLAVPLEESGVRLHLFMGPEP